MRAMNKHLIREAVAAKKFLSGKAINILSLEAIKEVEIEVELAEKKEINKKW